MDIRILKFALLSFAYFIVLVWPVMFLGAFLAGFCLWMMGIDVE